MAESKRAGEAEIQMGLFHSLRRSFKKIDLPKELQYTSLGSSMWRQAAGKTRYLKVAKAVSRDRNVDITTPIAGELYGSVADFRITVGRTFKPSYWQDGLKPDERLMRKLTVPLSIYNKAMHATNLASYYDYLKPRDHEVIVTDAARLVYKNHRRAVLGNWQTVSKFDADDMLPFLESNVNIGSDLWISQNKKNFVKHFEDVCKRRLGHTYDFTADGIIEMTSAALNKKVNLPYTAFYRGKSASDVRSVFGGSVLLKAMGALLAALKGGKVTYPSITTGAKLPWGPWEDWSTYFPKLAVEIDKAYERESVNAVGEDIIGWDTRVSPTDLRPLVTGYDDKLDIIHRYILFTMENARVFWGPYILKNIFYVSGHPGTAEYGSVAHLNLMFQYEEENETGAKLIDGSVASDDNMMFWENLDIASYFAFLESVGYPVKLSGSSSLSDHGYVRFLQNDVGRILKEDDKCIYVGAYDSRYPKLIHMETGGDTMVWETTGDVEVDRIVSKLGSFGEYGQEMVQAILGFVRSNEVGRRVISAISNIDTFDIESRRRDVVGYHPSWLASVVLPDISKVSLRI